MEYRRLGRSGVYVSPLCLGTMMFGDRTDQREAVRIVGLARDAGVNFVDTADVYSHGQSERVVGRAIADHRDWWVVATKAGNPFAARRRDPNARGLGRLWLQRAAEASLRRLSLDVIDLYYLHVQDRGTPFAETVVAMGDLIRAGKIRYWGISNHSAWQIVTLVHSAHELGVPPPLACQPYYNAMNRMPEVEILPACHHYGIGVVPYSPLARGVLTGKYGVGDAVDPTTRAGRQDPRMMETEFRAESRAHAQSIETHAKTSGITAVQFAVNWVLNNRAVASVIAGPRTVAQWMAYVKALDYPFTAEDEAFLDRLVAPGHPSTPGYTDPRYPVIGRFPRAGAETKG